MTGTPDREPAWAQFPGRSCRQPFTENGLTDHACGLPEHHPGPDAARSSAASIARRIAWEDAHPGWDKLVTHDDPFADITTKLKE